MDGAATMAESANEYLTPARILLPRVLKARDGWKAKCQRRRAQVKALQINVRDLTNSRAVWRRKHEQLRAETDRLDAEAAALRQRLEALEGELRDAQKK